VIDRLERQYLPLSKRQEPCRSHSQGITGDAPVRRRESADLSRAAMLPSASPSPTLVPRVAKTSVAGTLQQPVKAVPSGTGNISPTSTSFSTMPGSPGSLNLRPEHEMHLGDLGSLDLDLGFDDDDGYSLSEHQ